jgi:hypothetical protein
LDVQYTMLFAKFILFGELPFARFMMLTFELECT